MRLYSRFNSQLNEDAPLLDLTFDDREISWQAEEAEHHLAELGRTLDFEPEDLIENRAGYLSAAQAKRLWNSIAQVYRILIFFVSVGVFILGVCILPNLPCSALWLILMFCLMGTALVLAYDMRRQRATFPDRTVHATPLRLNRLSLMHHRWGNDSGVSPFTFKGDNQKLIAEARLYTTLHLYQEYTAYYVKLPAGTGYRMVSIEPTGDWVPFDNDNDEPREYPKRKKRKRLT